MNVFHAVHRRGRPEPEVQITEDTAPVSVDFDGQAETLMAGLGHVHVVWDAVSFVGANDFAAALEQIARRVRVRGMPRGADAA